MTPTQPSIPRDTRLLLSIVLISMALLWVLARIRFPERPPTPNPVPPVLAQLAPPSAFDDIVATVSRLQPRLASSLVSLELEPELGGSVRAVRTATALRFRDDLAVALIASDLKPTGRHSADGGAQEIARDRASGLVLVHLAAPPAEAIAAWSPRRADAPRFLMAAAANDGEPIVRPVFVGTLREMFSPIWSAPIWLLPATAELAPGTFLFTSEGTLAGLAVDDGGRRALVPAPVLLAAAERLLGENVHPAGWVGVEVQPISRSISAATGSPAGVIVAWVDPGGPAAGRLIPTDVIEQINGDAVSGIDVWRAHVDRAAPGAAIAVRVRRAGALVDVALTAAAAPRAGAKRPLGLTLRSTAGGVAVVRVDPDSAAARAGVRADDVLTAIGDVAAPTAAQAAKAFAAASSARPILVAVTRGSTHLVIAVERTW